MSKKIILPEEIAQSYRLVPGSPVRFADWKHGEIDFTTLTKDKADALFNDGCEFLEKVKEKPNSKNETV